MRCAIRAGLPDPPELQSEQALAAAGRVLIEITVERIAATSYI
jgi:hypothetical protein